MKLSRRDKAADDQAEPGPAVDDAVDDLARERKGRPTPKRRDSQGRRGPLNAPKTRKEAYARQKQLAKSQPKAKVTAKPRTVAEQRAALRAGDPTALPRRDQ